MPKFVTMELELQTVRAGDFIPGPDKTVATRKLGTKNTTLYDLDDRQIVYARSDSAIQVQRSVPTAQEELDVALEYAKNLLESYDETVRKAQAFDVLEAFRASVTGRDGSVWRMSSSFQLEDFINRQAHARFWAQLPTLEALSLRENTKPLTTVREQLEFVASLHAHFTERYVDSSPQHSSSQLSNLMDEAERETMREAVRGAFGSGFKRFVYQLEKVQKLEAQVAAEAAE